MQNFTPVSALIGGVLIGLSSLLLLTSLGRVAGISGILGGVLSNADKTWRLSFLTALIASAGAWAALSGDYQPITLTGDLPLLITGGLLVGFGTRMGSGCTSGHGVCGLARFSPRSAVAVVTFMVVAISTVFITRHLL